MSGLRVSLLGVGLLGPGLPSWSAARAMLCQREPYSPVPATLPPPARLPPAERRRAGPSIRLAMAVADEAIAGTGADLQRLATVFASSGGEGSNCHALCETLAGPDRHISPTRFTNSVHNAAAGYWHIAVKSQAASTSLSAYDGSFCAGLIEAATQVRCSGAPVLLVACDVPYPEPLHSLRPLPHHMGVALMLGLPGAPGSLAELEL
ncbi:MAG: beta-ketoacyl synthase chain length factor, partial [Rhizobacter sp.]